MKTIVGITEELTFNQLSKLDSFVILYNKILHQLYVDLFIKKLPIKKLSPTYQAKYSISKRHFNSIHKLLEGKVSSVLALNKNYIIDKKDKIKDIEKDLFNQTKNYQFYINKYKKDGQLSLIEINLKNNLHKKIKYNHIRLDRLKVKLKELEEIKETGNVRLCFGSNKLFRQQFEIKKTNNLTQFKSHEQWYKEFNYQRNKEFTLIGSKDENNGNQSAVISHIKGNLFSLKLNINHKAEKITDKYIDIKFTLNYEVEALKQIIINNQSKNKDLWQALTYKLIKQPNKSHHKNKYVVSISFEKHLIKKTYTSKNNGCLGVDINQDHLAISNLDNKGNLLNIYTFNYDLNGNKHQNNNSISLAVKDLIQLSVRLNKPIVIEELDFRTKKKSLKSSNNFSQSKYIKARNKQLSCFAYSKIIELIKARAEDNYIEVKEVNPAYTSLIGSIKYSERSRIDVHHGAAMCIGRKGLFNTTKVIKVLDKETNKNYEKVVIKEYKEKRISHKNLLLNRQIKSSNLPERNNLSSVVYWKELKKIMIESKQHEKKSRVKVKSSDIFANHSTSLRSNGVPIPVMNVSVETLS